MLSIGDWVLISTDLVVVEFQGFLCSRLHGWTSIHLSRLLPILDTS